MPHARGGQEEEAGGCSCSSPSCTGLLLGAVASVLVVGGILLAFHHWDYNWLLVTAIGSLLVLVAAAVPFCSRRRPPHHGKRPSLHAMANSETLPSAPPLSATYSVSQLSLNILPPLYPGCEELPQNSPPNGVPVNHIMNINGQSYLLLPIVSPTTQTSSSTTTESQNPCYSAAALTCLQVALPSKQGDEQSELSPDAVPATQRDLLCESPPADDTRSPLRTTNVSSPPAMQVFDAIPLTTPVPEPSAVTSNLERPSDTRISGTNSFSDAGTVDLQGDLLGGSESISDQLPLIVIEAESSETAQQQQQQSSRDDSAAQGSNASQAENDTDFLLAAADASDDDDDRLVGATPPPSYDEVASERNPPGTFEGSSFGTL